MLIDDPTRGNFASRSFLIIEDFEAMRGILRDLLRRCGARHIEIAANAQEALNVLRRGRCDVVLCDYHLGLGKNGQQVLEEARHEGLVTAATIWIVVTAEKTSEMVLGTVEHQPDDYLLKPVTEAAMQTRLDKLIKRKSALAGIAIAMRNKEYLRALNLCKVRLEQDAGNPMEILRIQADLYQLIGQPEQAHTIYDRILSRREIPWARLGLAKLLMQKGNLAHARDMLEQLLADNSNYVEAYDLLASLLQRQSDWLEAERILRKAVAVSPNSLQRQSALGDVSLRCDDLDAAEVAYRKALKLSTHTSLKSPAPYLGLARVYTMQHKSGEALKMLAQLDSDFDSDNVKLQGKAEEVRVHHASDNPAAAEVAAKEVMARIQSGSQNLSPGATIDIAETFMIMGDRETASGLLQFVVRNNHEDEELAARSLAVYKKGNMADEGRALIESSRRQATDAMDHGVSLAAQGKQEEALEYLREARAMMPRNPRLLLNYAYVVIALMQKSGWRNDLEAEARRAIATARQVTPGEKRCGELLAKLETLN